MSKKVGYSPKATHWCSKCGWAGVPEVDRYFRPWCPICPYMLLVLPIDSKPSDANG